MAEIEDVAPGADVLATWGNTVRDRSTMRYTSLTALETQEPNPPAGSLRWTDDVGLVIFTGSRWGELMVDPVQGGNLLLVAKAIELGQGQGPGGSSYIDFHANDSENGDRTGRIFVNEDTMTLSMVGDGRIAFSDFCYFPSGSVGEPGITLGPIDGTGIYSVTAGGEMRMAVKGVMEGRWTDTYVYFQNAYSAVSGSAPNMFVGSNGLLWRSSAAVVAVAESDLPALASRMAAAAVVTTSELDNEGVEHEGQHINFIAVIGELLDRIEALEA